MNRSVAASFSKLTEALMLMLAVIEKEVWDGNAIDAPAIIAELAKFSANLETYETYYGVLKEMEHIVKVTRPLMLYRGVGWESVNALQKALDKLCSDRPLQDVEDDFWVKDE